tara:strand:+ start:4699 stop:5646 length:948 start_codon:yes stop_codon:yes gene_type:complete
MRLPEHLYLLEKKMKFYQLQQANFLFALSGGQDSLSLLAAFLELKKLYPLSIRCIHVHHGEGQNKDYRDQVLQHLQNLCEAEKLTLVCKKNRSKELCSEEDFRNFRWQCIYEEKQADELVVTAHHWRDQFESRMMHLIRGCGPEGLLAMQEYAEGIFRPLIECNEKQLKMFYQNHDFTVMQDPSNQDMSYFRNWLRHVWLPQLETAEKGSYHRMAQSLVNISEQWISKKASYQQWLHGEKLLRRFSLDLDFSHQLQVLSLFLRQNRIFGFQRGQLEEILKRLDCRKKDYIFSMLGRQWHVGPEEIVLLDQSADES